MSEDITMAEPFFEVYFQDGTVWRVNAASFTIESGCATFERVASDSDPMSVGDSATWPLCTIPLSALKAITVAPAIHILRYSNPHTGASGDRLAGL